MNIGEICNRNYAKCGVLPEIEKAKKELLSYWGGVNIVSKELTQTQTQKNKKDCPVSFENLPIPPVFSYLCKKYKIKLKEALWFYCGKIGFNEPEFRNLLLYIQSISGLNVSLSKQMNYLATNILPKGTNVLQPQMWQIFILQLYIESEKYLQMNELQNPQLSEQEKWKLYLNLFTGKSAFLDIHALGKHEEDLKYRGELIGQRILENEKITLLRTMDGHGRFLCEVLSYLFLKQPNFFNERNLKIELYDVDWEVNYWHEITTPNGVSKCDSIFEHCEIETTLLYLNFSGLCSQSSNIIRILNKFKEHECLSNFFVSFSTVRNAKVPSDLLKKQLMELTPTIINYSADVFPRKRTDFLTFGFPTSSVSLKRKRSLSLRSSSLSEPIKRKRTFKSKQSKQIYLSSSPTSEPIRTFKQFRGRTIKSSSRHSTS